VEVNPVVLLLDDPGSHDVGIPHLSTKHLELQIQSVRIVGETPATLLYCNKLKLASDPDLIPSPVQGEGEPKGSLDREELGIEADGGRLKLVLLAGLALGKLAEIDAHGRRD
jgi:hypothetical protein